MDGDTAISRGRGEDRSIASIAIIQAAELHPLLDRKAVIEAVRAALIAHARGHVQSPLPGQLQFPQVRGDCHIKFCALTGAARFVVKVATGFYENPRLGLPVNDGLVAVFDASTGAPRAIFADGGWLTAWRTAAAAALAAAALAPPSISAVGILGTGLQAGLATEWLPETLGPREFVIHGRNTEKADLLVSRVRRQGGQARRARDLGELFAAANVIVTATCSKQPLFPAELVQHGAHIVALGADGEGKQELPDALFSTATIVAADDHEQCVRYGDLGAAVRAGTYPADRDILLGNLLSGDLRVTRGDRDVTIADLTGIAAEDLAIAELFAQRLEHGARHWNSGPLTRF